jgi:hypothetical protein
MQPHTDKEVAQRLQEMMEHLLEGQAEMKADINDQVAAHQDKVDAVAKAHQDQLKQDIN